MRTKPYRPPLRKRLLKHPIISTSITFVLYTIVRLIFLLQRRSILIHPSSTQAMAGNHNAIFCFWHGRMLFMPFIKPSSRKMIALISRHGDGGFLATMLSWFGVGTVRGSSSKGGATALRELLDITEAGHNIGITPDGPRGPHQVAAIGAVWLAAQSGLPIIPVSASCTRRRHTKSWDAFTLPLPFGHIFCEVGEAMMIDKNNTDEMLESQRAELQRRLIALTVACDTRASS